MNTATPDLLLEQDEKVMALAVERMRDRDHLVAAAWRKTANPIFIGLLADLAIAKRNRNNQETVRLCSELMWELEDAVLTQCRKEVTEIGRASCRERV
jgi:hypothetical protein